MKFKLTDDFIRTRWTKIIGLTPLEWALRPSRYSSIHALRKHFKINFHPHVAKVTSRSRLGGQRRARANVNNGIISYVTCSSFCLEIIDWLLPN